MSDIVERMRYEILMMAGPLHDGAERGHGRLWHAVPHGSYEALCGRSPSIQWSTWKGGDKVTCPKCARRALAREGE